MITFYDKLQECLDNQEELINLLINFDYMLEQLHNNGLCIYDFNPQKIILYNGKFTYQSFNGLLNHISISENMKSLNIYQLAKIGIMAFNNQVVDGKMNQDYFDFFQNNLKGINSNGNIPEILYEYYEELFLNLNVIYLNDYLSKKAKDSGNQNNKTVRKSLATDIGRAYAMEDKNEAFISILFIPGVIALAYIISLFIYVLFNK